MDATPTPTERVHLQMYFLPNIKIHNKPDPIAC